MYPLYAPPDLWNVGLVTELRLEGAVTVPAAVKPDRRSETAL